MTAAAPPTVVLLLRHAAHARVATTLVGRTPGVSLSPEGRAQARALAGRVAARLPGGRADAVWSSPRERARETAAPVAARLGLAVEVRGALDDLDFGPAWTGRTFADLDAGDADWRRWNARRGEARPPGGEAMAEAGARVLGEVRRAREAFPGGAVVMVSHCDAIRAALCAALRLPLDEYHRFEVAPASLSVLSVRDGGEAVVAGINEAVPERDWRAGAEAEAA